MDRSPQFVERLGRYRRSVQDVSSVLNAYARGGGTVHALGSDLEGSAAQYFESASSLTTFVEENGRDTDGADVLLAMIGVDMMVMRQAALTAWFTDETDVEDATTPELRDDQLIELHPDLDESTLLLLAQIGAAVPPPVAGASADIPSNPELSVRPSVDHIVDTAGDDLERILKMGTAGLLGTVADQAAHIWTQASPQIDKLFRWHRLRWLAARAVEAARSKLISLLALGGQALPALLSEFADYARKAVTKVGLATCIRAILKAETTVDDSNRKLHPPSGANAVLAAEKVAEDHKRWRHWIPLAANGGRIASALIPTAVFPPKAPALLVIAVILIALDLWAAGAYLGSPRLTPVLRFGVQGIPQALDQAVGASAAVLIPVRKKKHHDL